MASARIFNSNKKRNDESTIRLRVLLKIMLITFPGKLSIESGCMKILLLLT